MHKSNVQKDPQPMMIETFDQFLEENDKFEKFRCINKTASDLMLKLKAWIARYGNYQTSGKGNFLKDVKYVYRDSRHRAPFINGWVESEIIQLFKSSLVAFLDSGAKSITLATFTLDSSDSSLKPYIKDSERILRIKIKTDGKIFIHSNWISSMMVPGELEVDTADMMHYVRGIRLVADLGIYENQKDSYNNKVATEIYEIIDDWLGIYLPRYKKKQIETSFEIAQAQFTRSSKWNIDRLKIIEGLDTSLEHVNLRTGDQARILNLYLDGSLNLTYKDYNFSSPVLIDDPTLEVWLLSDSKVWIRPNFDRGDKYYTGETPYNFKLTTRRGVELAKDFDID